MPHRSPRSLPQHLALALCALALLLVNRAVAQPTADKRPLNHGDYDSWRSIQGQRLSPDGKFLAYALVPQDGDGVVVVRNLADRVEWRYARGSRPWFPSILPRSSLAKSPRAEPPTRLAFTADSRFLVFQITPTKGELENAKKAGKADESTRNSLGLVDLKTGAMTRIARVKSFQLPEDSANVVVYHRDSLTDPPAGMGQPGKGKGKGMAPKKGKDKVYGTELVVRRLVDHNERIFADVLDYTLSKDGRTLVFTVASKDAEQNGVFAVTPGSGATPVALLSGPGRYVRLTWDEKQTQLAFLRDRADPAADPPRFTLHRWDRKAAKESATSAAVKLTSALLTGPPVVRSARVLPWVNSAALRHTHVTELVSAKTPGVRAGLTISENAPLAFSPDGARLFLGLAPVAEKKAAKGGPDRVVVELWHWKDDFIQPMQKVQAGREAQRTFRAVYHLREKKLVQLADATMADVNVGTAAGWALGSDDRPYRTLVGYDAVYSDHFLVDLASGARKPLLRKAEGGLLWSTGGKYALFHYGKDWHSLALPGGKVTNLTGKLGVRFTQEDYDAAGTPPAYGVAGWTPDDRHVLLHDRHDLWQVAADGSGARNLTDGLGRREQLQFRVVRLDPREKTIDPGKPLLLRAESLRTRDTGFYRLTPGASRPEKLLMGAKNYGPPQKARDADVLVLTASTFYEFPDLLTTTGTFKELTKVSDANPQKAGLRWGKAELVHFKSLDGAPLQGVLIKPENFDPNRKYPLLVYIYEKLSHSLHNFVDPRPGTSVNFSYYASNGYLVFLPDIVYKVGYPGQSALKCVLPGVQAVVGRGCVDEKAIGIQGHSWGGYQIAYMVTQTDRFKAASAGAPVANMTSAYGGIRWGSGLPRQFQYERTQSRIGGSLWQHPLRFIENSPLFMADRVKTPVMMLHNDQDDAVPWQQGIEFFLALRRLGKEAYLFNYPGEFHGLRKRSNQRDYTIRLQQFFDHHLKGAARPEWMERGIPYRPRGAVVPAAPDEP
ncbi:MAG: prolyl oligopeptidase family serine peptidase [Gemmataceae bacterium]|nr:prolyl oligopeptidase family serine peptidase [Gemmataceae bacterium]